MEPSELYTWNLPALPPDAASRPLDEGERLDQQHPAGPAEPVAPAASGRGPEPAAPTGSAAAIEAGRAVEQARDVPPTGSAESDSARSGPATEAASAASELEAPLPNSLAGAGAPVMVHALRGSIDAGHAGALVVSHLLETLRSRRVATFDLDELLDYRSRRPALTFERSAFVDYAEPQLALDWLDTGEGGLLLLHGPEPDLRWERFASAVEQVVERLGVRTTVGLHGIPMGVPHTRPIAVTAHATREGLVDHGMDMFGTVQVPGSASSLLEYRLGQRGHDAMGFAVHVPHYLAQSEYPAAAVELVRSLERVTGADLRAEALVTAAKALAVEIEEQVAASAEVAAVVSALETQYDAYQEAAGRSLLASEQVPSADELAAQFEAFLAEQGTGGGEDEPGRSS